MKLSFQTKKLQKRFLNRNGSHWPLVFLKLICLAGCLVLTLPFLLPPTSTLAQQAGPTPTASQKGNGSIKGRIINGTAPINPLPAGQTVKLEMVESNSDAVNEQKVSTGPGGEFLFQDLPVDSSYSFFVSTLYAGVTYYSSNSASLKLTSSQPSQSVELKVYEVMGDPAQISFAGNTLVISQVDAADGQIQVLEMFSIQNQSDRTFVGAGIAARTGKETGTGEEKTPVSPVLSSNSPSAHFSPSPSPLTSSNKAGNPTLRFFLPTGASGLTPAAGINPGDIVETTDGIEVSTPVFPGENQWVFSYNLPYQGETFSFNKKFAYATSSFRLFTPVSGPKASSSLLKAGQPVQMGQQRLNSLSGQNFKEGAQVQIDLSGLPLPPNQGEIEFRNNILKGGILLLSLASLVFLFSYSRKNRLMPFLENEGASLEREVGAKRESGRQITGFGNPEKEVELQREKRNLIYKIARLDHSFEEGQFEGDNKSYLHQREAMRARLAEIWDQAAEAGVIQSPAKGMVPASQETGVSEKV